MSLSVPMMYACGGDDDDDDTTIVDVDADTTPDAASTTPDAAVGGADAQTFDNAANLGVPCAGAAQTPCPNGEPCVLLQGIGSQTEGFCTIPCSCPDQNNCDHAACMNQFPGPGQAGCFLTDGMGGNSCAILCGQGSAGQCPIGLGCFEVDQGDPATNPYVCAGDE